MGGFLFGSLLALVIIGIACLPATNADRERAKRNQQGNLLECRDRNPSDYGLPHSQIATALREVHTAMQMLSKRNVSNNSLPIEIAESSHSGVSLMSLLDEDFNVSSVQFLQQLQLYRMVMQEVSKNSDKKLKKSLGRLVNKVWDVQKNLTCLCHVASGGSGQCQQPDDLTRFLGSVRFQNSDHSMEAGACVLVMMNRTLTNVENTLHLTRPRRGSNQGQRGRQQKRNKGKSEEAQAMATPDDIASRVVKKLKKAGEGVRMEDLIKPKRDSMKGDNSRKGKGGGKDEKKQAKNKKKQPKDKKRGNKQARQQQ